MNDKNKSRDELIAELNALRRRNAECEAAERALRESRLRHALAADSAGIGIWDLDLIDNVLIWDDWMYRIYGVDPEHFSGAYEAWKNGVHPEDLAAAENDVKLAVTGEKPFDTTFRIIRGDGDIRRIKAHARVTRDEEGRALRMIGVNLDITERQQAEDALREMNRDFVAFLENTQDFVYFKDRDSRFRFCSQSLADITGHKSWREMIGKHDLEVFPEDTARIYHEEELPIFEEGRPLLDKTDPYYDEHGEKRWVSTRKWPLFGPDGKEVVGLFGISRDITEQKQAGEKLAKALAEKDVLLKEIHHRVKNNMQTIVGLLYKQQQYLADDAARLAAEDSINRVKSMALVHEQVYRSESLSDIDMAACIRSLSRRLLQSHRPRDPRISLHVQAEDVHLPADIAIPAALILNELIANALKHAFPDGRAGDLWVACRRADAGLELMVRDNGAGLPENFSMEDAKTLGVYLVYNLAVRQLGGSVRVHKKGGTEFVIRFNAGGR